MTPYLIIILSSFDVSVIFKALKLKSRIANLALPKIKTLPRVKFMSACKYLQVSGWDEILIQFLDRNTCNNPVFSFDRVTGAM